MLARRFASRLVADEDLAAATDPQATLRQQES
jgi:hypothetical protein